MLLWLHYRIICRAESRCETMGRFTISWLACQCMVIAVTLHGKLPRHCRLFYVHWPCIVCCTGLAQSNGYEIAGYSGRCLLHDGCFNCLFLRSRHMPSQCRGNLGSVARTSQKSNCRFCSRRYCWISGRVGLDAFIWRYYRLYNFSHYYKSVYLWPVSAKFGFPVGIILLSRRRTVCAADCTSSLFRSGLYDCQFCNPL